jgi:hypothetical protein
MAFNAPHLRGGEPMNGFQLQRLGQEWKWKRQDKDGNGPVALAGTPAPTLEEPGT